LNARVAVLLAGLACARQAQAQAPATSTTNAPPGAAGVTEPTKLQDTTVVGHLDQARSQILTDVGGTTYSISKEQIESIPGGEAAGFNQLLLRTPGMAEDSLGQLHLRGEHANIQYRIDDVLLPEGITGFGQELDTRFVEKMQLITGSLPAEYGFRTAGIVDVTTKSGAYENGGSVATYGGSYNTIAPSFEYGGSQGKLNYFVDGSFNHNDIGIENPTASATPIHDMTEQYKTFAHLSYVFDDTSRITVMLSGSYSTFEVPNTPGLAPGLAPDGVTPWNSVPGAGLPNSFNSANLNETQNEQNFYGVAAYQKSVGDFNMQVAAFGRNSGVHFTPDSIGDLYFNGVAADVNRSLYSGGLQADASYSFGEAHTLRGGFMAWDESATADSTITAFELSPAGTPTGLNAPVNLGQPVHGIFYGLYLQDEWRLTPRFTINYGARFDAISSYIDENQISPRLNSVWKATDSTTLHGGYSRYFTPPPLELVNSGTLNQFSKTSNAAPGADDPVKSERAHYFDAGITQKITKDLQVGVDGYYKIAHNQLDDGFFGQTLILAPFNYRVGDIEGVELTVSYTKEGFSAYANVALSDALGKGIDSSQFLLPDVAAYTQNQYIHLDHDQRITGSFGTSYVWKEGWGSTRVFADALYGSGLRADEVSASGALLVPNGISVGPYYSVSLGAEQGIKLGKMERLKARLDVVNITDNVYELRNGSGVGVNAAQYGMRLGFFGSVRCSF
jgi:outer membrane receptor protein involved in Fe transport